MDNRYSKGNYYLLIFFASICFTAFTEKAAAQIPVFVETFGNTSVGACDQGTLANGFVTSVGTWTVTDVGVPDSAANQWYISATEPGMAYGSCSTPGCYANLIYTDRTLHIGNVSNSPSALSICPSGDCGALYDPGNGVQQAVQSNKRAESPVFTMQANTVYLLVFNYLEAGDPMNNDNTLVQFFDGTNWVPSIGDPGRTTVSCGGQSLQWDRYSITLPVLPATINNAKIGFDWSNDNDGFSTNPSFAVDSIIVFKLPVPVANISASDTDICVNDCIDFFADSVGPVAAYSWTFTGASTPSSSLRNPTNICYSSPGTYPVSMIASTPSGVDTAFMSIVVNPCMPPTSNFYASDTVFCERSCINFNDASINGATGWSWSFPGGIPTSSSSPTPPPICYQTPGFYDVTLVAYNQYGSDTLTKTAYLNVTPCPFPIADFNSVPTQFCPKHCVSFTDNSQFGPILSYDWSFPGGTPSTDTVASPLVCYDQEGQYDVQLIVTNQYGSDTIYKYSEVTATFVPGAFANSDTSMAFGQSYQLLAGGGVSYSWSPGAGLDSTNIPNPVATPRFTTTYTVAITDGAGCVAYRHVTVTILHNNDVFVPNSFSPNGDGVNDYVYVRGNNLYGVRLTIFDRWGEKVFEATDQSHGWDGTYKGEELDPAVFTYVVTVNYNNKESVTTSGTITLVR